MQAALPRFAIGISLFEVGFASRLNTRIARVSVGSLSNAPFRHARAAGYEVLFFIVVFRVNSTITKEEHR
ncbi:protein of unknown function (plasmid) [Caballeronia sp. S22]